MIHDPLFTYDDAKHEYKHNSIVLPHPTGLLKECGLIDYTNVPPERLEYKRQIGSAVDKACELHDEDSLNENTIHPVIAPFVLAWIKFREIERFTPLLNQTPLVSGIHHFAGRLDKFGVFRGYYAILDIKCTWSMYQSTGPQLASYEILIRELAEKLGLDPAILRKGVKRWGVLLKESGNYELVEFKDPRDKSIFLSCLQLHYWKKKYGGVKNGNENASSE